jgi:signal transduction histidine kinase
MPYTDLAAPRGISLRELSKSRLARRLVPVIYVMSAVAFVSDLQRYNLLAYGVLYSPLVATAVFHKDRRGLRRLTALACVLVIVGAFTPVMGPDIEDLIGNRLLSILAIFATAIFVHHARDTQERLAAETRRAEAAERIKTDVLNSLSEEIRTPLHSLLGVLTLTMSNSAPGQREVLTRVRSDARQLLASIDSLIDLSVLGERGLLSNPVDIGAVATEAAATASIVAKERQITVAPSVAGRAGDSAAVGDPAAVRRILDTFLADALRSARPGETISVVVARAGGIVTASVSDPGDAQDGVLAGAAATGLVLSRRLAHAMKGSITSEHQGNTGPTITLRLPAA